MFVFPISLLLEEENDSARIPEKSQIGQIALKIQG